MEKERIRKQEEAKKASEEVRKKSRKISGRFSERIEKKAR
jgi:hypothetical protein